MTELALPRVRVLSVPWALLGIAVLPAVLVLPLLSAPIQFNDAVFMAIGQGMRDGGTLYVDLFDNKPPPIYLWFAFFNDLVFARAAFAVTMSATAVLVALIGREFYGRLGDLAGAVFGLTPALFPYMYIDGNVDRLTLLPATAAFLAALERRPLLSGVLIAVAAMVKPVAVLEAIVLLCFAGRAWKRFVAGGVLAALALTAPIVLTGLGGATYDAVITFNREYGRAAPSFWPLLALAAYWMVLLLPLTLPASLAAPFAPPRLLLWTAACLGASMMTGMPFSVYAWHFIPGAALLLPAIVTRLHALPKRRSLTLTVPLAAVVASTLLFYAFFLETRHQPSVYSDDVRAVSAAVHGRVWIASDTPEVYYLSGSTPATRYLHPIFLHARPHALQETVQQLQTHPPDFIVFDTSDPDEGYWRLPGHNYARIREGVLSGFPSYVPILETGTLTVLGHPR
jgi:hypothetical protein